MSGETRDTPENDVEDDDVITRLLGEARSHLRILAGEHAHLADSIARLEELPATLSHELRAPLRVAEGLAAELRAEHGQELSRDALDLVDDLIRVLVHADELVRALAAPPPEEGGDELPPTSVAAALEVVRAELAQDLGERSAVVSAGPLPVVRADRVALTQVLRNLVENAVKHNPRPQPHVTVSAIVDGDVAEIAVADDGEGIPRDALERIFERGVRAGGAGQPEGSGIGLDVCRRLVADWGGEIWAQTTPDGAVFRFTARAAQSGSSDV